MKKATIDSPPLEPPIEASSKDKGMTQVMHGGDHTDDADESISPMSGFETKRSSLEPESMPGYFSDEPVNDQGHVQDRSSSVSGAARPSNSRESSKTAIRDGQANLATHANDAELAEKPTTQDNTRGTETVSDPDALTAGGSSVSDGFVKTGSPERLEGPLQPKITASTATSNDDENRNSASSSSDLDDRPLGSEPLLDPGMTPTTPVMDRLSPPAGGVPYYAAPKIMVHQPSQSSLSDISGPRTIDQVLANSEDKRRVSFSEGNPGLAQSHTASSTLHTAPPAAEPSNEKAIHKKARVKKRSLYLRKARNLAARKTFLKLTLGRELAVPTKEALRHLAHGESVIVIQPQASETPTSTST